MSDIDINSFQESSFLNDPHDYKLNIYSPRQGPNWIWLASMANTGGSGLDYNSSSYPHVKGVAELLLVYDQREAEHDGYCSDPGSDTGEVEKNNLGKYILNDFQLMNLREHIDPSGIVNPGILQQLFDKELIHGYCYYRGFLTVKSGKLARRYVGVPIEEICLKAFNEGKEDPFTLEEYLNFYHWNRYNQILGWLHLERLWEQSGRRLGASLMSYSDHSK